LPCTKKVNRLPKSCKANKLLDQKAIVRVLLDEGLLADDLCRQVLDQAAEDETLPCDLLVSMGKVSVQQILSAAELFLRAVSEESGPADTSSGSATGEKSGLSTSGYSGLVGHSPLLREIEDLIRKVAVTDSCVLIQGESGTGKELIARAVHSLSRRSNEVFVSLNCSSVPSELIESELFGHKKGAFTGSIADHPGIFKSAHGGTLFLDEIEATPLLMQVKLLRAIELGEIRPVGGTATETVNVRIVAASNRNIEDLVRHGGFREDLYFRLNVFPIFVPSLRERKDDIPLLAGHFLEKFSNATGKRVIRVDRAVMEMLIRYPWPGNVRELENEIERLHVMADNEANISVRHLSPRIIEYFPSSDEKTSVGKKPTLDSAVRELEIRMIKDTMDSCQGNRSVAARHLGLSRQGLLNKLHRYRLDRLKY
jgi:transcriptional regulator with PAS, ATPase and Fis domain